MAKTKSEIINEIEDYFSNTYFSFCYVGVSSNARKRLFVDHNVSEKSGDWIHNTATSHKIARDIEEYFLDADMDGETDGGDEIATQVYAYKKTPHTKE